MYEGKKLGEAIGQAIQLKGIAKSKLAQDFGVSAPSVSGWVNTGRISKTNLNKLINYFSDVVSPEHFGISSRQNTESNVASGGHFLLWGSGNELSDSDYVYAPFYKDISLAAGSGSLDDIDYNGFKLPFARATLRRFNVQPDHAVCLSVSGNSMEPVLPDGSTVGVNTGCRTIKDGAMYAINHGGLLRIKLLSLLPNNKVKISSYNHLEYPEEVASLDEVQVIGKIFTWSVMVK